MWIRVKQKVDMEKNIFEIVDRIRSLKGLRTDAEVASALDMTTTALSNHKTRRSIPYEALSTFCDKEKVSLDWLLTGEGEIKRGERGERPHIAAEPAVAYNVRDVDMQEIVGFLKENPVDKKVILKLIKSKKMAKEALEEFAGVKGLVEEG